MTTRVLPLAVALLLVPVLAGAQSREYLQLSADLRILSEQVGNLQLGLNQLTARVEGSERRIDSVASATQKSFADQTMVTREITTTLAAMRERLDENTTRVSQLTQELLALREGVRMVTEQLNTLVGILQPPVNPMDANAAAGAASPLGTVNIPPSPTDHLKEAMTYYQTAKYDLAIEAFKDVITTFPGSPQAASAQFWMAETYYQQDKCGPAIAEYDKLITTYKDSDKVPDAYFMKGACYEVLKRPTDARKMFQQLITLFPDSDAAISAKSRLDQRN